MYGYRNNRSKRPAWGDARKIEPDETLVAFRMSRRRYEILKAVAAKNHKPIAQLINEVLDNKLKLSTRAEAKNPTK